MSEECVIDLEADYDLAWHIGSVFIIMSFSFLGTTIPFLFKKYFSMSSLIFQSAKLLGAGVILSTAFNHMLTAAFENLVSPCSGIDFPALAGVCALMGVLFTLVVQLIASETLSALVAKKGENSTSALNYDQVKSPSQNIINDYSNHTDHQKVHHEHPDCVADLEIVELGESAAQDDSCATKHDKIEDKLDSGHDHSHGGVISHSNRVTAYLLELGIAVHSVIIGIALGVSREEFRSLFIALVFHQFFEGIGLSSVVSEADFKKKWIAIGLVAFYTISTPIGVAIGIGIHDSLDLSSARYLVTQGVLDGLAAGILIYDGLVNIVIPHFNGRNFRHSPLWRKVAHVFSLCIGSALMAIISIWA